MSKRGRTFTMSDDVHAPTPTLHPRGSETGMSTSVLMLTSTSTNYRLWAVRMEVSLAAHDSISESQSNQIDIKKSAKEN